MEPTNNKLFVWNISWNLDWQELKEAFSKFWEVTYVKVVKDRETGRSRGIGFVEFANFEDAKTAMNAMNWAELDGRALKVDFAQNNKD